MPKTHGRAVWLTLDAFLKSSSQQEDLVSECKRGNYHLVNFFAASINLHKISHIWIIANSANARCRALWSDGLQINYLMRCGSRDGAVVRALASHQCDPGSIPGPGVICGLSLLLVLFSAPRHFSPGTLVFPSPQKPTFPNSNSIWNARTFLNEFLWTPWCSVAKHITFKFFLPMMGKWLE